MIVSKLPFFLWCQRKKQRELLGIGMLAMLSHTQPRENGSHLPPAHASHFLNPRIAPTRTATDSEDTTHAAFATLIEIVRCAGRKDSIEEFQFWRLTIIPKYSTLSCAEIDGMCDWD